MEDAAVSTIHPPKNRAIPTPEEQKLTAELSVMRRLNKLLAPLSSNDRRRILAWAIERTVEQQYPQGLQSTYPR